MQTTQAHLPLALVPQSLSFLSFLSVTGKQRTGKVPYLFLSPNIEMADSDEERLSFKSILTAVAELFLKPYYFLISSFFPNIVLNISENKLDTIFTVAGIHSMDVRAEACLLTSKTGPREIRQTEII